MDAILGEVIFAPGSLAKDLTNTLVEMGHEVTLFSPGEVTTLANNVTSDMSLFDNELNIRGDSYLDLLRKHPMTFVTLARQVQAEIIAKAYAQANADKLDIVHIYTNEEETALPFANFCNKPVVFTHHDPFNFLVKHKNVFPKYKDLNWISISLAQRQSMPPDTNWVGNIYHGIRSNQYSPTSKPTLDYLAYYGRIIEQKGVHLAIKAVKQYNQNHSDKLTLKIAGKHYADNSKDKYWREKIEPELSDHIQYLGFLGQDSNKREFLSNAKALFVPSTFAEPFGMVSIEALASGTPVLALDSGALPEIVKHGQTGFVIPRSNDETTTIKAFSDCLSSLDPIDRLACRRDFETRFTIDIMANNHIETYNKVIKSQGRL